MKLLKKFQAKLGDVRNSTSTDESQESRKKNDEDEDEDFHGDKWLSHKLDCELHGEVLAKDASTKKDDWYDVYHPNNPINKRKRGEDSHSKRKERR